MTFDQILENDIENISQYISTHVSPVCRGKRIYISGASGFLGSLLVKGIARYNEKCNCGDDFIFVTAASRSLEKKEYIFGSNALKGVDFSFYDIRESVQCEQKIDYIIHCASQTSSRSFAAEPVETISVIIDGTRQILELAKKHGAESVVFISSLEVYGLTSKKYVTENDLGFIDPLAPRSSYSAGKRFAETICASYAAEYNVPVKIVRLTQTFGAGIMYGDNRVFAQFARSVIENKDIVLKTKGKTFRSYCYSTDAVCAFLTVLLKGKNGEAYNVGDEKSAVSVAKLARIFCLFNKKKKLKLTFDLASFSPADGYNPIIKTVLKTAKIEQLGWKALVPLKEAVRRLIYSMEIRKTEI